MENGCGLTFHLSYMTDIQGPVFHSINCTWTENQNYTTKMTSSKAEALKTGVGLEKHTKHRKTRVEDKLDQIHPYHN